MTTTSQELAKLKALCEAANNQPASVDQVAIRHKAVETLGEAAHTALPKLIADLEETERERGEADEALAACQSEYGGMKQHYEQECERLREALRELVNLKDHKDKYGKSDGYLLRQPKAWEAARRALGEGE